MPSGAKIAILKPPRAPAELVESLCAPQGGFGFLRFSDLNLIHHLDAYSIHAARESNKAIKNDEL